MQSKCVNWISKVLTFLSDKTELKRSRAKKICLFQNYFLSLCQTEKHSQDSTDGRKAGCQERVSRCESTSFQRPESTLDQGSHGRRQFDPIDCWYPKHSIVELTPDVAIISGPSPVTCTRLINFWPDCVSLTIWWTQKIFNNFIFLFYVQQHILLFGNSLGPESSVQMVSNSHNIQGFVWNSDNGKFLRFIIFVKSHHKTTDNYLARSYILKIFLPNLAIFFCSDFCCEQSFDEQAVTTASR